MGKYPIKLRIISNRVPRDYQTIYDLSEQDYKKLSAPHITAELQDIRKMLQDISASADAIIKTLELFEFSDFEKEFIHGNKVFRPKKLKTVLPKSSNTEDFDYSPYLKRFTIFQENHSRPGSISITFLSYIKKLLQQGRIGNAINYQRTYRSLKEFRGMFFLLKLPLVIYIRMKLGC